MSIPTRKEWQKTRDAAGGKAGEAEKVSVGDALDDYHKAAAKADMLDSIRPLNILEKELKAYQAEVTKTNSKLAKAVESKVLAEVEKAQEAILEVAKYPGKIAEGVDEI